MTAVERTFRTIGLELTGGREIRVGLWSGTDGEPGETEGVSSQ